MKLIISFLLCSTAAGAFAQATGSRELTLDDAVKLALDKNYTAVTAADELQRTQYGSTKASDALLPSVIGKAGYTYNKFLTSQTEIETVPPYDVTNGIPDASHGFNYSVTAAINIFNGGFDAASIRSANYALDAAKYNLKWTRQSVAFNVVSDYVNALRTKELLKSAQLTYSQDSAQLSRVQAQYDAGALAINGVYQQQAVVGQDKLQTIQAKNNFQNALADLLLQLNIPPSRFGEFDVSLQGIDTTVSSLRSRAGTLQVNPTVISDLLDRREDFAAQRATLNSEQAGIDITRAALLPTLNASLGVGGNGSNTDILHVPISNALTGALTLSVPIYEKSQTGLQMDIQQVQLDEGQVQLDQSQQQFRDDITKAQNNLNASDEALDAANSALTSADESLRSAVERLRVGAGIQVDVIIAQSQVQTARTNQVNAVYNYVLAVKQLEYLLGKTNY